MKPDPVVAKLAARQHMTPEIDAPTAGVSPVASEDLQTEDFPGRGATFDVVQKFGYSFDGYAALGMEDCAKIANAALSDYYHKDELPDDLDTLRACMFFEVRRWSLYEQMPDTKANIYMFALVDAIREKLEL